MFEKLNETMEFVDQIKKAEAEKKIQPFKTNNLLDELIRTQTPKWVNYIILIISFLALLVGLWALLHTYSLV